MKVATWNVNSLTARWPRVESWLIDKQPDVVLVQETKQTDAKFPFAGLADLGYDAAHYGQGQWNGVAVISRVGLADVERGFGDEDPEARLIGATCAGVRVYSCYVPNGRALDDPHYTYKLGWLAALAPEQRSHGRQHEVPPQHHPSILMQGRSRQSSLPSSVRLPPPWVNLLRSSRPGALPRLWRGRTAPPAPVRARPVPEVRALRNRTPSAPGKPKGCRANRRRCAAGRFLLR